MRYKKYVFGLLSTFILLLSLGCQNVKEQNNENTNVSTYSNDKVTIGNIEIATISKIVNSNKKVISDVVNDEYIKLVYEKNSISNEEYDKYVEYFYDECYGFTSMMGSISLEDGNYIEFVKPFNDKLLTVLIKENISDSDSQYSISYKVSEYDENYDEIYYNKSITTIEDGEIVESIIQNDKCD